VSTILLLPEYSGKLIEKLFGIERAVVLRHDFPSNLCGHCQAEECESSALISDSRTSLSYCAIHYRVRCETEQEQTRRLGYSEAGRMDYIQGGCVL
jgi:hypothetical protein